MKKQTDFGFGIEAEFLLVDARTFRPLGHRDLSADMLLDLIERIPADDFSSEGLNVKPLHRKPIPYLVEGYYLPDKRLKPSALLPKGLEIRTPLCATMEESVAALGELYRRLQAALREAGLQAAVISHHPTEENFHGPRNYRRHDYWQWAMTAMTTYGPDLNISLPSDLAATIDLDALTARVNYYIPSLTALTLSSPLVSGGLWRIKGLTGKSIRTYRRSCAAPPFYVHRKPALRFELKCLEMSRQLEEYRAALMVWLAILTDSRLAGKASEETRIYDMGQVAIHGLDAGSIRERAGELLERAEAGARASGFDASPLGIFRQRLDSGYLPADEISEMFRKERSIEAVMRHLSCLEEPSLHAAI